MKDYIIVVPDMEHLILKIDKFHDSDGECYLWEDLEKVFGEEYKQFEDWMRGQGCHPKGAYTYDVSNYFYRRDKGQLHRFPHLF